MLKWIRQAHHPEFTEGQVQHDEKYDASFCITTGSTTFYYKESTIFRASGMNENS